MEHYNVREAAQAINEFKRNETEARLQKATVVPPELSNPATPADKRALAEESYTNALLTRSAGSLTADEQHWLQARIAGWLKSERR